MAITHYATGRTNAGWPSGGVRSVSLDVGSGADRVLLILAYTTNANATTIDSATYNGVALTSIANGDNIQGYSYRYFYLCNPASGTNTLSVTSSDDNAQVGWGHTIWEGIDQASPLNSTTLKDEGSTGTVEESWSQTSNTGEQALCFVVSFDTGGVPRYGEGSGFTERFDDYVFVEDKAASASSTTMAFTPTVALWYFGYSVALKPSGGSGIPKTNKLALLGVG